MRKLLGCLVELLGSSSSPPEEFLWAQLDYDRTLRLRQALVARYPPATVNLPSPHWGVGLPGFFFTSEDETNWYERSYLWHEGRSIQRRRL